MNDRAALYAAICANPDDDTPRLVFADWLEEHREPKRAAFIRAQIEADRLASADTPDAWFHHSLSHSFYVDGKEIDWSVVDPPLAEIYTSRQTAEKLQTGPMGASNRLPKLKGISFVEGGERGFCHWVVVKDTAAFLRHAERVFRATPITDVTFCTLTPDDAKDLATSGCLARIRYLNLLEVQNADTLAILGAHRDAAGVQRLELRGASGCETADLADAFLRGPHWTGLREIELTNFEFNTPAHEPLTRLFRRPPFAGLQQLDAYGNIFGDTIARAVAAGGLPDLRYLKLDHAGVDDRGAGAIARSKKLPELRYLDIGWGEINDRETVARLIGSPHMPHLTVLNLGGANLDGPYPKHLGKTARGPTLRSLTLGTIAPTAAASLAACPAIHGLRHLDLSSRQTGIAFRTLLESPGLDRLTVLELGGASLNEPGIKALANWPKAASIQWLNLNGPMTGEARQALVASPHLSGVKRLLVSGKASEPGVKQLKQRFGNALERRPW